MNPAVLTEEYINQAMLMQVATTRDERPRVCTVYFVTDHERNLYWLSEPHRRHSAEIQNNHHVAIAIAVKKDIPVIGIQAEGIADPVTDHNTVKLVMEWYVAKYNAGKDFYHNWQAGANRHQLYKFTPSRMVLFDEVHFGNEAVEVP